MTSGPLQGLFEVPSFASGRAGTELSGPVQQAQSGDDFDGDSGDQSAASSKSAEERKAEIVVRGTLQRGAVKSDVEPLRVLTPIDLRAYGAQSLQDLIKVLGSELESARGAGERQPIVLLNGRRISSLDEISSYPPEAIERVEVFPEQLALDYGFPPNQKVVNLITFERFRQKTGQINVLGATEGGGEQFSALLSVLKISGDMRLNGGIDVQRNSLLRESDRGIIQPDGQTSQANERSLLPRRLELGANVGVAGVLTEKVRFSLTANGRISQIDSLLGSVSDQVASQNVESRSLNIGSVVAGNFRNWSWSQIGTFSVTNANNAVGFGRHDGQKTRSDYSLRKAGAEFSARGSIFRLPAGSVTLASRLALQEESIRSRTVGGAGEANLKLSRGSADVFSSLNVPLVSKHSGSSELGDISFNVTSRAQIYEDRPKALDVATSVTWAPIEGLRLNISYEDQTVVPTLQQLGEPAVTIPNIRAFDFETGKAIDVSQVSGGNNGLSNQNNRFTDFSGSFRPSYNSNFYVSFGYSERTKRNRISNFPILTREVRDTFRDRVRVGPDGAIVSIDSTPVNIFRNDSRLFNIGLNWSRSLGVVDPNSTVGINPNRGGELPADLVPPGGEVVYAPPGTPLPRELINALSRVFVSARYSYTLSDTIQLTRNSRSLNMLSGFSLSPLGGTPRHDLRVSGGLFRQGLGISMDLNWRSNSFISNGASPDLPFGGRFDIDFDPVVNLQIFLNPQERINGNIPKVFDKMQLFVRVDNLLNARPVLRDATGRAPQPFQGAILEPLGRSVSFSIRKLF